MITEGLRTLLLGESSVTDIAGQKVYGEWAAQSVGPPYVIISRTSDDPQGDLTQTSGKRIAQFDVECHGKTGSQAASLAKAVADFLKDYTGAAGDETIEAVAYNGENDDTLGPQEGEQHPSFATILDLTVIYTPA